MASARELALEVLPHFRANVLARHVRTYGFYAKAIGRDAATESMVIGKAMHAIGGTCAFTGIPVAPLHYVKRADGEWRGIFQSDSIERTHVLPHFDLLSVSARIYDYTEDDFRKIEKALREVFPKYLKPSQLSPHHLWHVAILNKLKDSTTPFERSLKKYENIVKEARATRRPER